MLNSGVVGRLLLLACKQKQRLLAVPELLYNAVKVVKSYKNNWISRLFTLCDAKPELAASPPLLLAIFRRPPVMSFQHLYLQSQI